MAFFKRVILGSQIISQFFYHNFNATDYEWLTITYTWTHYFFFTDHTLPCHNCNKKLWKIMWYFSFSKAMVQPQKKKNQIVAYSFHEKNMPLFEWIWKEYESDHIWSWKKRKKNLKLSLSFMPTHCEIHATVDPPSDPCCRWLTSPSIHASECAI